MSLERSLRSTLLALAPWLFGALVPAVASGCRSGPAAEGADASTSSAVEPEGAREFYTVPDLRELAAGGMRDVIARWSTDRATLERFHDVSVSLTRRERMRAFAQGWRAALAGLDFGALEASQRVDYLLLDNRLRYDLRQLDIAQERWDEAAELLPFAADLIALQEARRDFAGVDARAVATRLADLADELEDLGQRARAGAKESGEEPPEQGAPAPIRVEPSVALRATDWVRELRRELGDWFRFYDGYDPLFSWWVEEPYEQASEALETYQKLLREDVAGIAQDDEETIVGVPIGREALLLELESELIPYTPAELVQIAEREYAWCLERMLEASRELGHGEDWKAALEHVKSLHVEPGEQPALIHELAQEAVEFLERNELITLPDFSKRVWRMEMMSPERQKYTPYFTGGEVISVAFPTDSMEHAGKRMSLRGNNVHFARATVHHELIPGHHLQQYMQARHATHRRPFSTPFWGEGWALYWEMVLWDADFQRSPEDRVGMLFWRMHRCARIVFSLRYQLGEWTPEECIDHLIENVGHERANATAEVRRSVQGGYGPLYQCAYMIGGLQFRALRRELVGGGVLSDRELHDAILRGGAIPVELVRAELTGQELSRDFRSVWRFYRDL